MVNYWRVKISYLPGNINANLLAQKFGVPLDEIRIPENQSESTIYAWVHGFESEDDAMKFEQRWDRARLFRAKIRCRRTEDPFRFRSVRRSMQTTTDRDEYPSNTCRNGIDCYNAKCKFNHPYDWLACDDGAQCEQFFCEANHPSGRLQPCPNGKDCRQRQCGYLHPQVGLKKCPEDMKCRQWECSNWHSKKRAKKCSNEEKCLKFTCQGLHPPEWNPCSMEDMCCNLSCELNHRSTRAKPCEDDIHCGNYHCQLLHPLQWDPCEQGVECLDSSCPRTSHPAERDEAMNKVSSSRPLKTLQQREREREHVHLPILDFREEFCRRLEQEHVLIVTAETGSGKSTQLPQYAAEYFGGSVVCTQPRVIAAISLARRVADEYDGMSIGRSVGYRVGVTSGIKGKNRIPGTDIMFMTDGALIQESIEDDQLKKFRVLIIDEAHERSLNTDIVMGIAKLLLRERPRDFYVVISSATIHPQKFLEFFDRTDYQQLIVPGRLFDVSVDHRPLSNLPVQQQVVSTLNELYDKHQGTTLVFLPGQREIEESLELFSRSLPSNCVAYPLYSNLSPEEQDRVLQFDAGENDEQRMVVFCTNIAETSLTINNTQLIIDTGLAKEPYYDRQLHLTTLEMQLISKASADQRKGRAGRTAPGHCVRLYPLDALTRLHIEPALVRSSLDLVVLQLIFLSYNPLEFPFVDSPGQEVIQDSLKTLEDLECLTAQHDLTLRGELFVRLNFDPRYSAFLIDAYLEHEPILELVTIIVSILTAPGSIFTTGTTNEERKESKKRIALYAKEYESDLLYFVSLYKGWRNIGALDPDTHTCRVCHKTYATENICRPCRASHSAMRGLNNKILNAIECNYDLTIKTIENTRWNLNPRPTTTDMNESDIIGAQLFKYFPTHHATLIMPSRPDKGARLTTSDMQVTIADTSTYTQRQTNNPQFIGMSITRLPGNRCIIERLHPCNVLTENTTAEETNNE